MAPASLMTYALEPLEAAEVEAAAETFEQLNEFLRAHPDPASRLRLSAPGATARRDIELSPSVLRLVARALDERARGNAVTVASAKRELTTQQAANLLNVSRPYLIKLLDERQIPYRLVGNRRKVLLADVLEYKRRDDEYRRQVVDELTREAEELGLDY
jgi:excisionase family DNA binding protein